MSSPESEEIEILGIWDRCSISNISAPDLAIIPALFAASGCDVLTDLAEKKVILAPTNGYDKDELEKGMEEMQKRFPETQVLFY